VGSAAFAADKSGLSVPLLTPLSVTPASPPPEAPPMFTRFTRPDVPALRCAAAGMTRSWRSGGERPY